MKNRYEVRGDTTVIFINRQSGNQLECLIDTADLPLVSDISGTWSSSAGMYAITGVGRKVIYMHRLIMEPPTWLDVDHANYNGLDNRRANLSNVTRSANIARRRPPVFSGPRQKQRPHYSGTSVNLKISPELHARVRDAAAVAGTSITAYVTQIYTDYFSRVAL